jgi:hypothetical protein
MQYRFGSGIWRIAIHPYLIEHNIRCQAVGSSFDGTVNIILEVSIEQEAYLKLEKEADTKRNSRIFERNDERKPYCISKR